MKRFLTAMVAGVAALTLAAGCGQRNEENQGIDTGSGVTLTSAPIDAALVTPEFGWVLTADALLLSGDGGATFRRAEVELPSDAAPAAYFHDADHGWVSAVNGPGITVTRLGTGSQSLGATGIPTSSQLTELSMAFGDTVHGALLGKVQTGGAFGRVAVEPGGRIWLTGGALGNELYTSRDHGNTWNKPQLSVAEAGTVEAVSTPVGGVVAVTVSSAGQSRVALLTSHDDGASWQESASVALATDSAVAPAVSSVPDSSIAVVDPAGARLSRAVPAKSRVSLDVSSLPANGLSAGTSHVTFASPAAGWALAATGGCTTGKQHCAITHNLVTTNDSGNTWHQALQWVDKIS